jgi:GntR family transcriptional regulator, transcriptional repressor for pyruvate dehydrogenase complex
MSENVPSDAVAGEQVRSWRPISRQRTYELVLDRVEEQILRGQVKVGDRLPAERELASLLGVSRSAVREAMRTLEAQGVVHSAVGTGPESGTIVAAQSSQALTRLLRLHVGLASFPLADLVEARTMLERWSVRLAARNAGTGDLSRAAELVAAMDEPDLLLAEFNDLDTAFHVAIADAGGNRLVRDITSAIRESLRHRILATFEALGEWAEVAATLRVEHHEILDRIAAGDPVGAADSVERHIRGFSARIPG